MRIETSVPTLAEPGLDQHEDAPAGQSASAPDLPTDGRYALVTITALGDSVIVAAWLVSVAGKGGAVTIEEACHWAGLDCHDYPSKGLQLKGRAKPVAVYVIPA